MYGAMPLPFETATTNSISNRPAKDMSAEDRGEGPNSSYEAGFLDSHTALNCSYALVDADDRKRPRLDGQCERLGFTMENGDIGQAISHTMTLLKEENPCHDTIASGNYEGASELSAPKESVARFRSHQAENWVEKFEELLDFRLKNGHCLVPNAFKENPSLAEWVKRQRYQYKLKRLGHHNTMSVDRIAALEKLGFVWNSHDQVWEERLKELKAYKAIFNTCNVPSNYAPNPQLAVWVKVRNVRWAYFPPTRVLRVLTSELVQ